MAISPRHYGIMMMNNRNGLKSSAAMRQFSVASHAHELLQKELDEEVEHNSTEMPQDLKVLQEKISVNWTIVDEDTNGTVKLFSKNSTSPKVSIVFHCQDTLESEYEEEEEQEGEEGLEPAMPVRFTVTASKAGKTMVFACLSEQADASIETVAITSNLEYAQTNGKVETELYQGPEFTELAVEVQDALNDYVTDDCGVNEDVSAFISMYADYKEQTEYVKWIKQVQRIIS